MPRYSLFLSGLGFGLVIAALLVMLNTPKERHLSRGEIETLARDYGMIYKDEVLILPASPPESPGEPLVGEENLAEKENIPPPIEVYIPKGSHAEGIAGLLFEQAVIADPQLFLTRAKQRGVTLQLEAGRFVLSPALTIDELIDQLLIPEGRRPDD